MWSYYGSKSKVVDYYPPPKYGKIIEPFAGTARYSLKWFDRDILLVDKYDVIVKIWKWLQQAGKQDIQRLPEPERGSDLRDYQYECEEAKMLMRFMIGGGLVHPQWVVSPQGFGGGVKSSKKFISENLFKIKNWKIILGDYRDIPNQTATWFIDPPYQHGGHKYKVHEINYKELAQYCQEREGQSIVCENTKADWLPFYSLTDLHGSFQNTTEAIWSNLPHDYMRVQEPLFT